MHVMQCISFYIVTNNSEDYELKLCFSTNSESIWVYLAAGRSGQYIVGVHGAQLVPAAVPARLALDADDLVDAL